MDEDGELNLNLGELDITTEDFDFDKIDDEIALFQQNEFVKEALEKGIDLRKYSREIENDLREVEKDSIEDYVNQSQNLAQLHNQIKACDSILETMENMLGGFQADLGNISSEIKHLQDESLSMNVKLRNRKAVETNLADFIEDMIIAPELIKGICDGEVNDQYLEYLMTLNKKISFLDSGSGRESLACRDVEAEVGKLRTKAVVKVRAFLLAKIEMLKKPKTNLKMLQQNVLLKFKYLTKFLQDNSNEYYDEVKKTYIDAMSGILQRYFKGYLTNMARQSVELVSKSDLIGADDARTRILSTVGFKSRTVTFSLSERAQILTEIGKPSIIFHVAQQNNHKYPHEAIFRSENHLLMDQATSEYLFLQEFFGKASHLFDTIFSKAISVFLQDLEDYLFTCYDAIGVLLMIRITHQHQLVMTRRRIPCLDSYFDRLNITLWTRFKNIFDMNVDSVKSAAARSSLWTGDVHPHFMVRRYAEFAASILQLNVENQDEMIKMNLHTLRAEMQKLLLLIAGECPDRKNQVIFLINNYDIILTIFGEHEVAGDEKVYYQDILAGQITLFVEQELVATYGQMINFVKESEAAIAASEANVSKVSIQKTEELVKDFAAKYKAGIDKINNDIMKYFSNFKNGMEILKQVLTQLLLYYMRFVDLIKKCFKNPPFAKEIVTVPSIMHEIKKYSKTF
eukprot:GFYU01006071.1.p1 GENE.GFYU01006071.1~~GFYU01006071.1.p1  ORF type:complete len:684 (-),score=185.98 GFYU01006071.1:62-2113(-)